ncbi:uncharacterized protein LOC127868467 [Dreissena polymorpha]|uniref:Uncharacterized protein n=1 Tax=Dreissena polymorpha TaxID=45954 RepID=A0A9D4RK62_DREPO|nr:uncharacterized protein LOC127868467 [Dreissena polymorpha]KAH3871334.1 hypothetical protein DPMN_034531 [Dreissena polymorpha]
MSERDALAPKRPEVQPQSTIPSQALYHDSTQTPMARCLQWLFVALVVVMVLVCMILSIVQGVKNKANGALYFMMGLSLLGFVFIEVILILFIRRDHLDRIKLWFLYFVGGIVILESIFTDVLLYKK